MLKKEDIKDGNLVFDSSNKLYGYLQDVGDARENGHRGCSTTPKDELSYTFVEIITGKLIEGICEHSQCNIELNVATKEDVEIYLAIKEAESLRELAEAQHENAIIRSAINQLKKIL